MNHPLAYFQRIYVINLASRRDRRRDMDAQLRRIGLEKGLDNPAVELFTAIRPEHAGGFPAIGARGCFLSHLAVLRRARQAGLRRLLILEDDLDFSADFNQRIAGAIAGLAATDWSFFYGSYTADTPPGPPNTAGLAVVPPRQALGTTAFIAINGAAIGPTIQHLETLLERPAGDPRGGPMHVDGAYSRLRAAKPAWRTLAAIPELGRQRSSRTDIHQLRWYDRLPGVRGAAAALRRLANALRRRPPAGPPVPPPDSEPATPEKPLTDPASPTSPHSFGIVAIGRNEGDRLRRCLASALVLARHVVYVDSGSGDGSVDLARGLGAEVVELDMRLPFTAARARNAGFTRLMKIAPSVDYIQFIDGDCEFIPGWLDAARHHLDRNPGVAVVCGRLRERRPEQSLYNLLCDMEWEAPPGETQSCGGIAMIRKIAFAAAGGFRADLIAGEEPELCLRLRAAGWRIWRLKADMAWHDAAMHRFGQWWKRCQRGGYAFAQGADLHEGHWQRETRSALFWGLALPACAAGPALAGSAESLLLLTLYPLQTLRLAVRGQRPDRRENWWRAAFLLLAKFPEAQGAMRYWWQRGWGGQGRLIEYK